MGHWAKVKGELDKSGRFIASELEVLEPDDKETLIGEVDRVVDREHFVILGRTVRIAQDANWKGLTLGDLGKARVRVQGHYRGPQLFQGKDLSERKGGRDQIEGRIDHLTTEGADLVLSVLGFQVLLPRGKEIEHGLPIAQLALAPQRAISLRRQGADDDDDLPGTVRLGDNWTLGGTLELDSEHKENYDLDTSKEADREDYAISARLQTIWNPAPNLFVLVGGRGEGTWRLDEKDGDTSDDSVVLNEAYVYWRDALELGWDVQLGRQDFDEAREWLYDQNLDALRLIRSTPTYRLELSASTTLSDGSPLDKSTINLIAYLSNNSERRHAALYAIDRRDENDSSVHSTHLGARLIGSWLPSMNSWLEVQSASGELGSVDLEGVGLDAGSTWLPETRWVPDVTLAYAWGSENFRQTGFDDDNGRFSGVTSFRYYGELFEPELANMSIATLAVGKRITRNTSLDLVLHKYDQVEAAPQLASSNLRKKPDGVHEDLGWEADLVLGSRAIPSTHIEAVLGRFHHGDAFPGADDAWLARLQIRFRF